MNKVKFAISLGLVLGFMGTAQAATPAAQKIQKPVPAPKPAAPAPALAPTPAPPPAPKVCFRDVREFEAVRTKLPAQLRSGAVYATHKSLFMKGGFKVVAVGARFLIEGKGKAFIGRLDESQYIKTACVQQDKLAVWLDDGRYDEILLEPTGIRFHDYFFKYTTLEGYERMIRSL